MKFNDEKILVTGYKGFIGSHLVQELLKLNTTVITGDEQRDRALDIVDTSDIRDIDDVDCVCHLAGVMNVPKSWKDPFRIYQTNVFGTLNLLEQCRKKDIMRIVFASSYLYGLPNYLPIDERHPIKLINPYMRSKRIAEEFILGYCEDYKISSTILRLFNIYGPGQRGDFLIPTIISQLSNKEIILENPNPRRDFLYVADAVESFILSLKTESDFEIFNVGSGESFSVDEIAKKIVTLSGRDIKVRYLHSERRNEIDDVVADISKIKKGLGWEPIVGIDDGLKKTIASIV